jgi:hypothetical protein
LRGFKVVTTIENQSYLAIEDLNREPFARPSRIPTWKRFIFSYHTRDISYTMAIIIGIAVIPFLLGWEAAPKAALLGGAIAGLRYLYDLGNQRLGMAEAIASDILSIGRVFLSAKIVDNFIELSKGTNAFLPAGFGDKARQENYFDVYERYIEKLGNLDAECVRAVTAFYKFLRASRDATRSMELWKESYYSDPMKKEDIIHVIYQCLLVGVNGEIALYRLRDDGQKLAAAGNFVLIQIKCIEFLNKEVGLDDYRRFWIEKRFKELEKAIELASRTVFRESEKASSPHAMAEG